MLSYLYPGTFLFPPLLPSSHHTFCRCHWGPCSASLWPSPWCSTRHTSPPCHSNNRSPQALCKRPANLRNSEAIIHVTVKLGNLVKRRPIAWYLWHQCRYYCPILLLQLDPQNFAVRRNSNQQGVGCFKPLIPYVRK